MGRKFARLILNCFIVIIFTKTVMAELKINEIYPAPPTGEYEWVEIYNDEEKEINLEGFFLSDLAGNKMKINGNSLGGLGFIIATSSSILNNNGDTVFIKNNLNETLDIATYSGNFDSGKTYAKCPDGRGNWFILTQITKNASNQTACLSLTPTPTLPPTATPTPTPEAPLVSYENIYLSEVMVYPPPGENEWVEIYNGNDFSVSLINWHLDDGENAGSSPKMFFLEVPAKSYGVFELKNSMFNNSGDSVRLLDFNQSLKDSFEYANVVRGETYGRVSFDGDDFCLQQPSKGSVNNNCLHPTATPTPKPTPSSTPTPTEKPPTPTAIFTNSLTKLPTKPPLKIPIIEANQQMNQPVFSNLTQGQVLGEAAAKKTANQPLINSLCLLSLSYSLAVIVSLGWRMNIKN